MGVPVSAKAGRGILLRFVLFVLALAAVSYAQIDTAWTFRYAPVADGRYQPMASFVDDAGNVCVVGWAEVDTVGRDVFLLKIDSQGHLLWHTAYDNVRAAAATRDTSGDIYTACGRWDPGANGKICLLKYKPNGDTAWVRIYEEAGKSLRVLTSIAIDHSQNVYIGGVAESSSCLIVRIVKYLPNGALAGRMSYTLGAGLFLHFGRFHILDNGEAYLALSVEHPRRRDDWLVVKLSRQGRVQWERTQNDSGEKKKELRWSQVDERANIYLTGPVVSTDTSTEDFCTMKMDSSGNVLWTKEYNGPEGLDDEPQFLSLDSGCVYVAGWSTAGWNTYAENGEGHEIVLVKYDSLGNKLWVSRYGGADTSCDVGYGQCGLYFIRGFCSMNLDESGNIYLTGSGFSQRHYFAFILKYDRMGNRVWLGKLHDRQGEEWTGGIVDFDDGRAVYEIGIDGNGEGCFGAYVAKYLGR